VVHQSRLSVRVSIGADRLAEIIEARGRLLAMLESRRAV